MLLIVLPALAAPTPLCVDDVPDRPRRAIRAAFDATAPPGVLVPLGWHRTGEIRPGGWYHDDRGRRFRYREVEAALLDNPLSQPALAAYRLSHEPDGGILDATPVRDLARLQVLPQDTVEELVDAGLLASFAWMRHAHFVRALCLFNATQRPRLAQEAARAQLMAEISRVRGADDPSMATWAIATQLYRAMDADHPADADAWRADVAAVSEALGAGLDVEAMMQMVRDHEGTLAQRVHIDAPDNGSDE
jgi:hypothetical protein